MRVDLLRSGSMIAAAGIAAVLAAGTPAVATAAATAVTTGPGQGSAYGADADVSLLSGVLGPGGLSVSTGELGASSTAGPTSASAVDAPLRGLVSAKAITSTSRYDTSSGDVTSTAALVDVALPVLAPLAGATPTASVISAQCQSTAGGITGRSDLADLNLGKIGKIAAATPNLTITVPGVLKIVADEQIHHADGSLTVNALDITLLGAGVLHALGHGQIVLASATCGPATAPPTTTTTPAPAAPGEVSVVPAGAPETGDGSLATDIVD